MRTRRPHIRYSADELAWLEANRALEIGEYVRGFNAAFGRDLRPQDLHALRKRKGWKTGRDGRFVAGQVAHNKGLPCAPGRSGRHPNAIATQFKKGQRPHTWRGAGHERVDAKDGYVWLIVAEKNPWTGAATRPVLKHKWLWEKENGPVPKGYCLKCRDGDRQNTDPSNWELIPRGVLATLNHRHNALDYDRVPAELKPTVLAIAKLKHGRHVKAGAA